jgi:hypothetical protein
MSMGPGANPSTGAVISSHLSPILRTLYLAHLYTGHTTERGVQTQQLYKATMLFGQPPMTSSHPSKWTAGLSFALYAQTPCRIPNGHIDK